MAVFHSFHYDRDAWRVQQILNMRALESQTILNAQDWEAVKKKGDAAIEKWIAEQMAYKSVVVVLVGAQTSTRPWVLYEIRKAWNDKRGLVGIRIHGLADSAGKTDTAGVDPFSLVSLQGGGTVANYVTLHDPAGADSKSVHASISANLANWAAGAYKRA